MPLLEPAVHQSINNSSAETHHQQQQRRNINNISAEAHQQQCRNTSTAVQKHTNSSAEAHINNSSAEAHITPRIQHEDERRIKPGCCTDNIVSGPAVAGNRR